MGQLKIASILALLLFLLGLRFFFFYRIQPHYQDGQAVSFATRLFSEPRVFGNYQLLTASLGSINNIIIRTDLYPKYHYQDALRISGKINIKWLENNRRVITIFYPKTELLENKENPLLSVAGFVRQKVIELFSQSLPFPGSGLLLGIVFGIKDMPKDFLDNLRTAGVMHVVAASGMNVTMVGGFFSGIFAFFLKRQLAVLATILIIIFYAFLAGFDAAIIRASIMGVLVFTAQILGRKSLAGYGLFLAAFVMIFINPSIIFDVGFQLSFAATFGLLYLRPMFEVNKKVKKFIKKSIIGEDISTTVAAQIATLPIVLANFGYYSIWSVLANGLVLWTVPFLMAIGGMGAVFGIMLAPLGRIILYLSIPLLFYFEKLVEIFGQLEGMVRIDSLPWQFVVGYYCLFLAFIRLRRKPRL